jgi:hypothetical protein
MPIPSQGCGDELSTPLQFQRVLFNVVREFRTGQSPVAARSPGALLARKGRALYNEPNGETRVSSQCES